jgi:hypothetical protein
VPQVQAQAKSMETAEASQIELEAARLRVQEITLENANLKADNDKLEVRGCLLCSPRPGPVSALLAEGGGKECSGGYSCSRVAARWL